MNYYAFHIGDYASATQHLTEFEDLAYRRLMDVYYVNEKALPLDRRQVYRLVRASSEAMREAVDAVLGEFFTEQEDGWHHRRCDAEIGKVQSKSKKAQENGKRGGIAKASRESEDGVAPAKQTPAENLADATETGGKGLAPNNQDPRPKTQLALASENARATEDVSGKADPKHWKPVQDLLAHNLADLDDWEVDFLHSVKRKPALTKAQQDSLASIQGKISAKPEAAAVFVSVKRGSPGYEAWITHYRKTMGRATFYEKQDVLTVPTEFPSQDSEAA